MRLFPATTIKLASECEHGEFINVRVGSESHFGLCIHNEDAKPHFLVLNSPRKELVYRLITAAKDTDALAFGTSWTLSPFGELLKQHDAADKLGAFIQTREGLFIVGHEYEASGDPLLCRLDEPGVLRTFSASTAGFAFPHWRIHYFDEILSKFQKLAGNEPNSEGK